MYIWQEEQKLLLWKEEQNFFSMTVFIGQQQQQISKMTGPSNFLFIIWGTENAHRITGNKIG